MTRPPAQVSNLLHDVMEFLPAILSSNLVGIYLYGSLTQRAFNPKRSDVDCIVVTHRALSDAQFTSLRAWLAKSAKENPWTARLQMLLLIRTQVLTRNSKACLYQFGELKRIRSDANPIIWMNVLQSGVVLHGPNPKSFVPGITPEILFRALEREVNYLRTEISGKRRSKWREIPYYRAYAVMTLCRILYSLAKGTVVSKPRAAKWAIKHLPESLTDIILQAQSSDTGSRSANLHLSRIRALVDFADAQLHAAKLRQPSWS